MGILSGPPDSPKRVDLEDAVCQPNLWACPWVICVIALGRCCLNQSFLTFSADKADVYGQKQTNVSCSEASSLAKMVVTGIGILFTNYTFSYHIL